MAQQHPLFDTFRAAEELANQVDQYLIRVVDCDDHDAATGIREATAFVMLHLVESFPRMGTGRPHQSLGKAREHLLQLQARIREAMALADKPDAGLATLEQSADKVVTKLAFTMSWVGEEPAASAEDEGTRRRSRIPGPLGIPRR